MKKQRAIVVDLGGTLAHRGERPKTSYMTRFLEDKIDETVRELVNLYSMQGVTVIIMTGQRKKSEDITSHWLDIHGVKYDHLVMKPDDETLDTKDWKEKEFDANIAYVYDVLFILEDREDSVEMWRNKRVRCFQTASGQDREYYRKKQQTVESALN